MEGTKLQTPRALISWAGHAFPVWVPDQRIDGKVYTFKSWSDGKRRLHDIVTPQNRKTYIATFRHK